MINDMESYKYLIEAFGPEKIMSRYDLLCSLMREFIAREGIETLVYVSKAVLWKVILDYFADIHRLKDFHNINKVNQDKITAYTLYWLIRRKPIQIREEADEESASFVNERFAVSYLQMCLFGDDLTTLVSPVKQYEHENFFKTLQYFVKYRNADAQTLELIIVAYRAGRAFKYSADVAQQDSDPILKEDEL